MKILVVGSSRRANWQSLGTIEENLMSSYLTLPAPFKIETVELDTTNLLDQFRALNQLSNKIRKLNPDRLVLLGHNPHASQILRTLRRLHADLPPTLVHIFGDFSYFSELWMQASEDLEGIPLHLIAASERSRALMATCCGKGASLAVVPPPIDKARFSFDAELRSRIRAELNVDEDEKVLLYVGRLHLQKGFDLILKLFSEISNLRATLVVGGLHDDSGIPMFNISMPLGYQFQKFSRLAQSFGLNHGSKMRYLGDLSYGSLCGLYCAADINLSLSLFHDEDFGLTPIEAGSCGLPSILTDWGGYSSYSKFESVSVCPVHLKANSLDVDIEPARTALRRHLESSHDTATRIQTQASFHAQFSRAAAARKLVEVLNEPIERFPGFSPVLAEFVEFRRQGHARRNPISHPAYKNLYKFYATTVEN